MEAIKTVLFLLLAGFIAGTGVLVVVGGADGEYQHDGIVRINHPYPDTFEFMTNPAKRKEWVPGLEESKKSGVGPVDVGTRISEVLSVDGVTTERIYEVTAFVTSKEFVIQTSNEERDLEISYSFGAHQTGRKTRLGFTVRAQYHHWFDKLIEPIRGSGVKKQVRGELEQLKFLLETTYLGDD